MSNWCLSKPTRIYCAKNKKSIGTASFFCNFQYPSRNKLSQSPVHLLFVIQSISPCTTHQNIGPATFVKISQRSALTGALPQASPAKRSKTSFTLSKPGNSAKQATASICLQLRSDLHDARKTRNTLRQFVFLSKRSKSMARISEGISI